MSAISRGVVPGGVAADAVLRWAGAFVGGFVSDLLRFPPDGGPPTWLRRPGVPFRVWFCEQSLAFSSRRGGPPTWLRQPGVPFREWFCKQSLAFSSGRGGRQLGYAGPACRFVCGVVGNLLRFPPGGGPANLVTLAWRAVSCVVLLAISCVFLRAGGPPTWLRRPGVPFREWFC